MYKDHLNHHLPYICTWRCLDQKYHSGTGVSAVCLRDDKHALNLFLSRPLAMKAQKNKLDASFIEKQRSSRNYRFVNLLKLMLMSTMKITLCCKTSMWQSKCSSNKLFCTHHSPSAFEKLLIWRCSFVMVPTIWGKADLWAAYDWYRLLLIRSRRMLLDINFFSIARATQKRRAAETLLVL